MREPLVGKSKKIRFLPGGMVEMEFLDQITAFNGEKKEVFPGKGFVCKRINTNCFDLLTKKGIPTHYLGPSDGNKFYARECSMIPYEIVVRRFAAGSYLRRHPETQEGYAFTIPKVEYFLKNDELGDPWVEHLPDGFNEEYIQALALNAFSILESAFANRYATLIDCKFEIGLDIGGGDGFCICDSFDNECWRLIYQGKDISKQSYRDGDSLDKVLKNYEVAHSLTCGF